MNKNLLFFLILFFTGLTSESQITQLQFNQYSNYTNTIENGNAAYIVYDNASSGPVNIDYSTDNGSSWISITSNYPNPFGGTLSYYHWSVPGNLLGTIIVKVTDYADNSQSTQASVTVVSPQPPQISIKYPNGGESFTALDQITIRYQGKKVPQNTNSQSVYKIEFSDDGGTNWNLITDNYTDTLYKWQIPFNIVSSNLLIRVSASLDNTINDVSDASFSSITNPVAGTKYTFAQNDVHGTVYALAKDGNGNIYVGGSFDYVDTIAANNVAVWNSSTGVWSALGSGVDSTVKTIAVNNGEVFVGGLFEFNSGINQGVGIKKYNIASQSWSNVASITQETTCTIACPAPFVNMISFDNNYMYVAGFFKTIAGQNIVHAAKLNLSSNIWTRVGVYNYGNTYTIECATFSFLPHGNYVYFQTTDDTLRKFDIATNSVVQSYFVGKATYSAPIPTDMLIAGDTLFVLFKYRSIVYSDYYLCKINTQTDQIISSAKVFSGGSYPKLAYWHNSIIIVFGEWGSSNSIYSSMISIPSIINYTFSGTPKCALVTNDNKIIFGGSISSVNIPGTNGYTRKALNGIAIADLSNNVNKLSGTTYFGILSPINHSIKSGNKTYVTSDVDYSSVPFGNIRTSNGKLFKGIAEWDSDSLKWNSLGTGLEANYYGYHYTGKVNKIIDNDSIVIAAGSFNWADSGMVYQAFGPPYINYIVPNNIAVWRKTQRTWGTIGSGTDGPIQTMVQIGTDIYVSGAFQKAGGISNTSFAKYNLVSKQWTRLNLNTYSSFNEMVADGTDIYVSGNFYNDTLPGGITCYGLAKYNTLTDTWSDVGGNINNPAPVAMVKSGNYLFLAPFDNKALVKFDLGSQTYTTIATAANIDAGPYGTINTLEVAGDELYIGGLFTGLDNIQANNFAKYTISTSTLSTAKIAATSQPGANGEVRDLKVYNNELYAAGAFSIINNKFSSGIGIVPVNNSIVSSIFANSSNDNASAVIVYPNPASDVISVKNQNNKNATLVISNAFGQAVRVISLMNSNEMVDVSSLSPGLYHVTISSENGTESQKLVISR